MKTHILSGALASAMLFSTVGMGYTTEAAEVKVETLSLKRNSAYFNCSSWALTLMLEAQSRSLLTVSLGEDFQTDINRQQIAEILVNMVERYTSITIIPAVSTTFTDTTDESVLKAYNIGLVEGKSTGIFDPTALATREEIAVMMYKTVVYMEEKAKKSIIIEDTETELEGFTDFDTVSFWATDAVTILVKNDLMKGKSSVSLSPHANTTIEECVVLALALYKK